MLHLMQEEALARIEALENCEVRADRECGIIAHIMLDELNNGNEFKYQVLRIRWQNHWEDVLRYRRQIKLLRDMYL